MDQQEDVQWPQPMPARDRRQKKDNIDVDMNPMVDLAFLLLTFFMLATTFSKPQVMELVMPVQSENEEETQAVKASQAITVILGPEDELFWYQGDVPENLSRVKIEGENVANLLTTLKQEVPSMILLLKPMDVSRYENLIDLLDDIQEIGIERYALTEITEEEIALVQP